jgi:hypothetical protein
LQGLRCQSVAELWARGFFFKHLPALEQKYYQHSLNWSVALFELHHHQITRSSHSINAIGVMMHCFVL